MLKKSLIAAGLILSAAMLTACGSSGSKQPDKAAEEAATQLETVVATPQTTAAEPETTTKETVTEKETTTKAAEVETTTKAPETIPAPAAQPVPEEPAYEEDPVPEEPAYEEEYQDEEVYEEAYEEEAYDTNYYVVSADGGLTLRDGPDSEYDDLMVIPDGAEIEIEEVEDGWGYVTYDGVSGWISMDFVE